MCADNMVVLVEDDLDVLAEAAVRQRWSRLSHRSQRSKAAPAVVVAGGFCVANGLHDRIGRQHLASAHRRSTQHGMAARSTAWLRSARQEARHGTARLATCRPDLLLDLRLGLGAAHRRKVAHGILRADCLARPALAAHYPSALPPLRHAGTHKRVTEKKIVCTNDGLVFLVSGHAAKRIFCDGKDVRLQLACA